jgi:hypothetical protein
MSFRTILTAAVCLSSLAACAPESPVGSTEADDTEASAVAVDTVYVVTRQDFRKCAFPMCGGVFVKAVNKEKTKCFDGSKQPECYVADIDASALGLSGKQAEEIELAIREGKVLLSGELASFDDLGEAHADFAKLVVHKGFDAQTDNDATGTFYLVEPSGITCIKAPCPNFHARKLNSTASAKQVTDIDVSALGLSDEETSELMNAAFTSSLIVSGTLKPPTSSGVKKLVVSQYFSTVEPETQLCMSNSECGADAHCDFTECLSPCKPGQVCPAVCYGACVPGGQTCPGGGEICEALCTGGDIDIPQGCPIPACDCPIQQPGSCFQACGGSAPDKSCYCDDACAEYGDCCADYAAHCQ